MRESFCQANQYAQYACPSAKSEEFCTTFLSAKKLAGWIIVMTVEGLSVNRSCQPGKPDMHMSRAAAWLNLASDCKLCMQMCPGFLCKTWNVTHVPVATQPRRNGNSRDPSRNPSQQCGEPSAQGHGYLLGWLCPGGHKCWSLENSICQ